LSFFVDLWVEDYFEALWIKELAKKAQNDPT